MQAFKQVLTEKYIGAIVIAMLAVYGIQQLIAAVVSPLQQYVIHRQQASILGEAPGLLDPRQLMFLLVLSVLYLGTAYALLRWLYMPGKAEIPTQDDNEPSSL